MLSNKYKNTYKVTKLGERQINMGKWKIFKKPKNKEETEIETIEVNDESQTETVHLYTEEEPETTQEEGENKPLAVYDETLHTGKKRVLTLEEETSEEGFIEEPQNHEERVWRDVNKIEDDVDNLHIIKAKKPKTNVEKTVDELIDKKKKKK